jgi:nucleotide-binding universal stress UspA family protein
MIRILVPTDFSAASRSGLRFAIQWSRQQEAKLLFVHVIHILRPTIWSDQQFNAFATTERVHYKNKLDRFISETYKKMDKMDGNYSNLILEGISPDTAIADYCRQHPDIDLICMGTRGAGKVKKIFGTHTGNLIAHSPIPVIAVQNNYKAKPVTRLLYATDLSNYEDELKKVVALAGPLKSTVNVLHFTHPGEIRLNKEVVEKVFKKEFGYKLNFDFRTSDTTKSLVENLQQEIMIFKPSMVVMFTDQDRTLFQKIFFPSNAENLSFQLKVPLLVFPKKNRKE